MLIPSNSNMITILGIKIEKISKCVFFSGCHNFYIIEVLLIKKKCFN
jgi:hypothetical protein